MILYLFHSKTGEPGISSSRKGEMRVDIKSKKGDLFDQSVVRTMQPLLIEDTKKDYRFDEEKMAGEEIYYVAIIQPFANWDQDSCHPETKYQANWPSAV